MVIKHDPKRGSRAAGSQTPVMSDNTQASGILRVIGESENAAQLSMSLFHGAMPND